MIAAIYPCVASILSTSVPDSPVFDKDVRGRIARWHQSV